jgi:signal transduction histidine kinase
LQVLENLLGNAIKFTPSGGAIEVRAERQLAGAPSGVGQVLFSVIDDGPGVAPAQIPYVFDRFWQGTRGTPESAGLGLAICKGIVEGHGGRIWIEPDVTVGATLRFTLPLAPG